MTNSNAADSRRTESTGYSFGASVAICCPLHVACQRLASIGHCETPFSKLPSISVVAPLAPTRSARAAAGSCRAETLLMAGLSSLQLGMVGRECHHCKQWVAEGQEHDCWTTTEAALTQDLSEDLQEAWERLRETAVSFGDQRIYASHHSIMFSRKSCYFFVRPKRSYLELCVFLNRELKAPQVRRTDPASKSKLVHFIHIRHRDEVEAPVTDWLHEAYQLSDALSSNTSAKSRPKPIAKKERKAARNPAHPNS